MRSTFFNVVFFSAIVFMIVALFTLRLRVHNAKMVKQETLNKNEYLLANLKMNYAFTSFDLKSSLISPEDGNSISFLELTKDKWGLFYRLPVIGCVSCIDEKLQMFSRFADSLGIDFCVIANNENIRNIMNYKQIARFEKSFYNSPLIIPELDAFSSTYAFLVNNNKVISIHSPSLSFPFYTLDYLLSIKAKQK